MCEHLLSDISNFIWNFSYMLFMPKFNSLKCKNKLINNDKSLIFCTKTIIKVLHEQSAKDW